MTARRVQGIASTVAAVAIAGPWAWSGPVDVLLGIAAASLGLFAACWLMPAVELAALPMLGTRLRAARIWYPWLVRGEGGWRVVFRRESTIAITGVPDGEAITASGIAHLGWSKLVGWITATAVGALLVLLAILGGLDDRLGDRWMLTTGLLLLLFQAFRGLVAHEGRTVAIWTAVRHQRRHPEMLAELAIAIRWQNTLSNVRPRCWPGWLVDELAATLAEGPTDDPRREARYLNAALFSLQRALDAGDAHAGLALARQPTGEGSRATWQSSPTWTSIVAAGSLLELRVGADSTEIGSLLARIPAGSPGRNWTPAVLVDAELMMRSGSARAAAALLARERADVLRELPIWPGFDWLLEQCDEALARATGLAEHEPPPAILPASVFGITSAEDAAATFAYGSMERSEWRFRTPFPGVSA